MQKVVDGVFVSVHYTGTLDDGAEFDSSKGRDPLEFKVGAGQMIQGFDAAVVGMSLKEVKTFTIAPEEAYGPKNDDHMHEFPRADIPPEITPEVGQTLSLTTPQGHPIPARIVAVDDEKVTFDLNHPLAGEALTFEVEVVGISETPTQQPAECGGDCSSGCNC